MYKEETAESKGECEASMIKLPGYGRWAAHAPAAEDISARTRRSELERRRSVEGSPHKVCNDSHFLKSNQTNVGASRRLQPSDDGMWMLGARAPPTEALHSSLAR